MMSNTKTQPLTAPCLPLLLVILTMLCCLNSLGCASTPALTVTSVNRHQTYRQGFTQAYISANANGDTDVVLVDRAAEQALSGAPTVAPVRQIMHIRIVWAPTRDMKAIVSNAAVKWYVISRSNPQDFLEYSGIAFVSMNQEDGEATLRVRNALLKPSANHGSLTDPIGPSNLDGAFVAHTDGQRVKKLLAELKVMVSRGADPTAPVTAAPLN